ncbi:type I restriction endonuclease subunit R, partial [Corynebacterium sp. LK2510]|uniref:type I restriction endonuclease subunit R n=1 Tax=Corynebacterium sp. LK2510 TaxID=3110472 RepID=UPI0034D00E7A
MSDAPARKYDPIAVSAESTVVAEYEPDAASETVYQSESALERELIRLLQSQAYEYLPITSEQQLVSNLRTQLEALNHITFSDAEWKDFFESSIAGKNDGIVEKTVRIQEDHVQLLKRDDGSTKNITLLDKGNIHNNRLQVINQYEINRADPSDEASTGGRYANRYDVTILVNGLPMVHVELKRRGVDIREAFNQIDRYQRDSFWAGSGLFEYVQLFVISNGTLTKYYSNTTRSQHLTEARKSGRGKKTSNSFEFTSWWADAQNKPIQDLTSFAKTFFAKHALLNILTKYCVLTADRMLLVMRPYQIVATERILQRIEIAANYKQLGTVDAGGYVWHTTGSGKTLTSFKTAQLASAMPSVDKVLFVVDRKDLDYQTMREYDRFQKGAANSNTSTAVLKRQLEDPTARIIITTIQKLSTFIKANKKHPVYDDHVVIIFDECHRSQFGEMHTSITRSFKRYNLFGFTGTPIFATNSGSGGNPQLKTTEQAFGDKLHTYTIVDAITDKNVLPFRIDYVNTIAGGNVTDKQVTAIATEEALLDPRRIGNIVSYTLEHFDQKTKRESSFEHSVVTNVVEATRSRRQAEALRQKKRVKGFNAIFATASIDAARRYYNAFQAQNEQLAPDKRLKIGLIYSFGANEAANDGFLEDEDFDTAALSVDSRAFLEDAIQDYNDMFGTSYDTSADRFQNYYKDLSQRLKNRELDLVIVVNMFLTGFDATTLNTLFVDKNLRAHGLIQAYSRTNRILNSVKTYGNIVAFRDLEEETNAALELFGNKDARGVVLLKPYADFYTEYADKTHELLATFPPGQMIVGEQAQKEFIALFGAILRLENILTSFDEFSGNEILTQRQGQDYRSVYLDLHAEFRNREAVEKEPINDDVVFEIELIKQVEINVDYILMLVEKYREQHGDGK